MAALQPRKTQQERSAGTRHMLAEAAFNLIRE